MLKLILLFVVTGLIGLGVGWGIAQFQIADIDGNRAGLYRFGPWLTARDESALASPLTLAQTDRFGPFGMRASEVMYVTAFHASSGALLKANKTYRVCGPEPAARFWSVTAYGPGTNFFGAPSSRHSISSAIAHRDGGRVCITIGLAQSGENWLPTDGSDRPMTLTVRLYNPTDAYRAHLQPDTFFDIQEKD